LKKTVFWDVALCNLVEIDYVLEDLAASMIRAMDFYETTRRSIPEDSHLDIGRDV
jgi:hypothetical protein